MSDSESVISGSSTHSEDCDCEQYINDDNTSSYSKDDYDDENSCIIRGKWVYDGSQSIDEMIACLQREIEILTELKENGWFLVEKVYDDYAFLRRNVESGNEESAT